MLLCVEMLVGGLFGINFKIKKKYKKLLYKFNFFFDLLVIGKIDEVLFLCYVKEI